MTDGRQREASRWIPAGVLLVLGGIVAPVVAMLVAGPAIGEWASVGDLPWIGIGAAVVAAGVVFAIGVALIVWAERIVDGPRSRRP